MPEQPLSARSTMDVLARLRRAADLYQATVRPVLLSDDPSARRVHAERKERLEELLAAIGEARALIDQVASDQKQED